MTPLVSIQNPGPEKCQEVRERELCFFSVLTKNRVPDMGEKCCEKKTESKSSWTLFFFTQFPPHVGDSVFFRAPKLASALDYPSATIQHQGSGNSFWGAKGSLYWFCPILILSKCLGWSNLIQHYKKSCNRCYHLEREVGIANR